MNGPWSDDALARLRKRALEQLSVPSTAETPPAANPRPRSFDQVYKIAALTSRFRLRDLVQDPGEAKSLEQVSVPIREPGTSGWRTLLPHVRKSVLVQIDGPQEAAELLGAYSPGEDSFQSAVSLAMMGLDESGLITMTPAQLAVLAQYHDELAPLVRSLPPATRIDRKLELVRLLDPLKRITSTFAGRESELEQLRQYVGVLELETFLAKAARALETLFQIERKKPLLIHGVGGVGKSSLLAKFILDHARAGLDQRFPFAYIDFDRPVVSGDEPVTILIEAIRQIALQHDESYDAAQELRERWQTHVRARASRRKTRPDSAFINDFAAFLETLNARQGPVLLVIDTFEEVQHRGPGQARRVISFLGSLSDLIPRMRVVIAGRADIPDAKLHDRIALIAFDEKSAAAYLTANGIPEALAPAVVKHVGGSPLSLNLAVKLYRMAPDEFAISRLKETITQGQLVDRILFHIQDPDVRKLAHPGLVLRRITPELILEVLAEPCNVPVPTLTRAEELFGILSREVSLVSLESERALLHRADVRQVMLGPLRDNAPTRVGEIHRRAIAYYEKRDGIIERAEEIYHRLALAQNHDLIAGRIIPGIGERLSNAVEDLAAPEQAFLADHFGFPVPPEALKAADQETWERTAARRVQDLMSAYDFEAARAVLRERSERSANTNLRLAEAMCLSTAGAIEEARAVARDGIAAYDAGGNTQALFTMLLVATTIERWALRFEEAEAFLARAEEIAERRNDAVMRTHVLRDRVTLLGATGKRPDPDLRERIRAVASEVTDADWNRDLTLLRDVAAIIGDDDPSFVERAARLGAIDFFAPEAAEVQRVAFDENLDVSDGLESLIGSNDAVRHAVVDVIQSDYALESMDAEGIFRKKTIKLKVTGDQLRELAVHLARLYQSPQRLADFVDERIGYSVSARSFEREVSTAAEALVNAAQREGWLAPLADAVCRTNFDDDAVQLWADAAGLGIRIVSHPSKTLNDTDLRTLLRVSRRAVGEVSARTCAIWGGSEFVGSGFLIGPATVATCVAVARKAQEMFRRPTFVFGTGFRATGGRLQKEHGGAAIIDLVQDVARVPIPGHPRNARHGFIQPVFRQVQSESILILWNDDAGTAIAGIRGDLHDNAKTTLSRIKENAAGGPCLDVSGCVVGLHGGTDGKQDLLLPITVLESQGGTAV